MSGEKTLTLADFRPLLDRLALTDASYALIGGLAVAHYAELYLSPEQKREFTFPIYSKDVDFQGDSDLKARLLDALSALGWSPHSGGKRLPKPGLDRPISHWITITINGTPTNVEILEGLPVQEMEFATSKIGSWIELQGVVILDPCTLLIAKLAALHGRPQGQENNDAVHCTILARVIPRFLRDIEVSRARKETQYDPTADVWRLWLVLNRGRFPLPPPAEAADAFASELHTFTLASLVRQGRLCTEAEARESADRVLSAHSLHDSTIRELRVLYTTAGWYWAALFACHGAPSHVALIDAATRSIAHTEAERALTYDRLSGGVLHRLHYLDPREPGADATLVAQAREKYLGWLADQCGSLQLDGLPADSDLSVRKMRLEELFVPLRLTITVAEPDAPVLDEAGEPIPGISTRHAAVETRTVGAALAANPRLALLAAPGGGKSTLLKRLAVAYADPQRLAEIADELPRKPWLPFRLLCRALGERAKLPIFDLLESLGRECLDAALHDAFRAHLHEALRTGHALLLIDGLDEISDDGTRRIFAEHLRSFIHAHPQVALVVTSREAGFRQIAGTIADVCTRAEIAPFEEADVERLCVNWHAEVVGDSEKVRADARALAAEIWGNERIRTLVSNPLLLTTLLVVKRWVGQLPQRRVTLYGKAIEVLLMTWNTAGHTPINDEEALPQLSYVATWMFEQGVQRIARGQLTALLKDAHRELESELYGSKLTPGEFIDRIERRSSLLVQVGHEVVEGELQPVYEFQHLTFQEYLTARGYVQGHRPGAADGRKLVALLEPHYHEAKWREVIALAVVLAKREASELIERLAVAADEEWKALWHSLSEEAHAALFTLVGCMLDEPAITPIAAEKAFRVIVKTHLVYEVDDLPMKLARGRYDAVLLSAALDGFETLDGNFQYTVDYAVACWEVRHGYPWTGETALDALRQILAVMSSSDHRERLLAFLVASRVLRGDFTLPWGITAPDLIEFAQQAGENCWPVLREQSRPLLVATGWCLGMIGDDFHWPTPPSIAPMAAVLALIERYRNDPPGGQMCYAFAHFPLLDRDAFPPARDANLAALVLDLEKHARTERGYGDATYQAATILAWYGLGPWSDEQLAKRIKVAFHDDESPIARAMLATLGEAGRAVLDDWAKNPAPRVRDTSPGALEKELGD